MTATTDSIVFAIDQLQAIENSVALHRLSYIYEYGRREGWKDDGAPSIEHWVSIRYGISWASAVREVALARAIKLLPAIAEAFGNGLLSKEKVMDLCSFVTSEDDERWAEEAQRYSAGHVTRCARFARRMKREEAAETDKKRALHMRWDLEHDLLRFNGVLPNADGALFKKAIERLITKQGKPPDGDWPPLAEQQADALVELAAIRVEQDPDASRSTVVVHVDARELEAVDGMASLENGPVIPCEVARRLVCDGHVQVMITGEDGRAVGIGRRSRIIPKPLERAVRARDHECVCCGSDQLVGSEVHHVIPWSQGGRTDLDNLVLVCRRCHRLLHDRGYGVRWGDRGTVHLTRPNGRAVNNRPAPLRPEIRDRMVGPPRGRHRKQTLRC